MEGECGDEKCSGTWPKRRQELNDCIELFKSVSNPEIADAARFNPLHDGEIAGFGSRSPSVETRDENYLTRKKRGDAIAEVTETHQGAVSSPPSIASKSTSGSRNSSRRRRRRSAARRSRGVSVSADSLGESRHSAVSGDDSSNAGHVSMTGSPSVSNEDIVGEHDPQQWHGEEDAESLGGKDDAESLGGEDDADSLGGSPAVYTEEESSATAHGTGREQDEVGSHHPSTPSEEEESDTTPVMMDHRSNAIGDPMLQDAYDSAFERQTALAELGALQRQEGVHLSREFNDQDSLPEIRFEIMKQLASIEQRRTVSFMKDMVKMGCHGIELFNSKMGPFLELDGWATEACRDLSKYEPAFCRLQRKYCRNSSMSPEMELVMGLGMSVGMYHFKQKMLPALGIGSGVNEAHILPNAASEPPGSTHRKAETGDSHPKRPPMRRAPPSPRGSDESEVSLL